MKLFRTDRRLTSSWDLITPSVELAKRNIMPVIFLSFFPAFFVGVATTITGDDYSKFLHPSGTILSALILLAAAYIWTLLAYPGYLYMQSRAIRGEQLAVWPSFVHGIKRILPLIGLYIISSLMIIVGLILFIIPGLIILRGTYIASFYVIDGRMGPIEAIKASLKATAPVSGWIWGTIGVGFLIGIGAVLLSAIPYVGVLLGTAIGYIYAFAAAIRYGEIALDIKPEVAHSVQEDGDNRW